MIRFLILSIFILSFGVSKIYLPKEITSAVPKEQQYLVFINAIIDLVKRAYIQEFSEEEVAEKLITGLFNELDPHTTYLDEDTFAFLKEEIKGKFGGIGIYIVPYDGFIKVLSCLDETPATKHLLPGDVITHVDNKFIYGMNIEKVSKMLKGNPKTKVKVTIKRKNAPISEHVITRELIAVPLIKSEMYNDIGYVKIFMFYEGVSKDFERVVKKFMLNKNLKGIIIDVRLNPGGILEETIAMLEYMLPTGSELVSVKSRIQSNYVKSSAKPIVNPNIPIAVLINALSASASEILAGTLKQNKRAVIIGELSYGKGSVQQLIELSQKTAVKMTVAKYYLPGNIDIQAIGIKPDIEVKTEYGKLINFREKDLPKTLKPDNFKAKKAPISKEEENNKLSELEATLDNDKTNDSEKKSEKKSLSTEEFVLYKKAPIKELIKKDQQLAKAFDVLSKDEWKKFIKISPEPLKIENKNEQKDINITKDGPKTSLTPITKTPKTSLENSSDKSTINHNSTIQKQSIKGKIVNTNAKKKIKKNRNKKTK